MRKWIFALSIPIALLGCKGLKEQQLGAYVGDSQTKIVYKNVGKNTTNVPEANRVFFRSVDSAAEAGYTLSNEADSNDKKPDEE
jgi:hypothetical protein